MFCSVRSCFFGLQKQILLSAQKCWYRWNIVFSVLRDLIRERFVTSFLTFLWILRFLLNSCYIYHHITCGATGKVAREVEEIGPWQCFSYLVSWMLESTFKARKIVLRITDEHLLRFWKSVAGLGCAKTAPWKVYNSVCRNQS